MKYLLALPRSECGKPILKGNCFVTKVVGGTTTCIQQFPWMVSQKK